MPTITDNFDDGVINADLWEQAANGSGSVSESGGKLKASCPSSLDMAGVVTKNPYDLTDGSVEVEWSLDNVREVYLGISTEKALSFLNMEYLSNCYFIRMTQSDGTYRVWFKKVVNGTVFNIHDALMSLTSGKFKLQFEGNTLKAYVNDALFSSDEYELQSKEVYVYVIATAYDVNTGEASFDNFSMTYYVPEKPPTPAETISSMINSMIPMLALAVIVPLVGKAVKEIKRR